MHSFLGEKNTCRHPRVPKFGESALKHNRLAHASSVITRTTTEGVIYSQIIRFSRIISSRHSFIHACATVCVGLLEKEHPLRRIRKRIHSAFFKIAYITMTAWNIRTANLFTAFVCYKMYFLCADTSPQFLPHIKRILPRRFKRRLA